MSPQMSRSAQLLRACITVSIVALIIGNTSYAQTPVLGGLADADHGLVVRPDGLILSWGDGQFGKLGTGATSDRDTAGRVLKGHYPGTSYLGDNTSYPVIGACGNQFNSFALSNQGLVYSWGYNSTGQLGIGSTSTSSTTPVLVRSGQYGGTTYLGDNSANPITAISSGSSTNINSPFCLALDFTGTVYAWGQNFYTQLGDGTTVSYSSLPVRVLAGQYGTGSTYLGDISTNRIIAISAGNTGWAMALAMDGTVYTWGYGGTGPCGGGMDGRLGNGSTTTQSTPVRVLAGQYGPGRTYLGDATTNSVIAISAGGGTASALMLDGTVYTWGQGCNSTIAAGKLGNGSTASCSVPVRVIAGAYGGTYLGESSSNYVRMISGGGSAMYALTSQSEVYAWGVNDQGQIGDGTVSVRTSPVRVRAGVYTRAMHSLINGGTNRRSGSYRDENNYALSGTYFGDNASDTIMAIAAAENSCYAISERGKAYSWGRDADGQLGDCATHSPTYTSTAVSLKGLSTGSPCRDVSLPIFISHFAARITGSFVHLEWETAAELNAYSFEIERQLPKSDRWQRLYALAAHGTTHLPQSYRYDDASLRDGLDAYTVRYRLKCVDLDGSFIYTDAITPSAEPTDSSAESAHHMTRLTTVVSDAIDFNVDSAAHVQLRVYDFQGRMVGTVIDEIRGPGKHHVPIETRNLMQGMYVCALRIGQTAQSCRLLVVH